MEGKRGIPMSSPNQNWTNLISFLMYVGIGSSILIGHHAQTAQNNMRISPLLATLNLYVSSFSQRNTEDDRPWDASWSRQTGQSLINLCDQRWPYPPPITITARATIRRHSIFDGFQIEASFTLKVRQFVPTKILRKHTSWLATMLSWILSHTNLYHVTTKIDMIE